MNFTVAILFFFIAFIFNAGLTIGINELVCAKNPLLRKPGEIQDYLAFSAKFGMYVALFALVFSFFSSIFK